MQNPLHTKFVCYLDDIGRQYVYACYSMRNKSYFLPLNKNIIVATTEKFLQWQTGHQTDMKITLTVNP